MDELANFFLTLYDDPMLFIVLGGLIVVLCIGYSMTRNQIVKWLRGKWW